jgi:hypothetical protein
MATAIEPVIEEVATNLDEAASAVRMLDARIMGAFTFGVVTGTVVGFVWGYRYNKTKLRAEIKKESEEEIAQMREYFQQRMIALQGEADKKQSAEVIVEERGYRPVGPPIVTGSPLSGVGVQVPLSGNREQVQQQPERPLPPPVPVIEDFPDQEDPNFPQDTPGWDYRTENQKRTQNPKLPYIIHMDEFNQELPAYMKTTYTYYPVDNILTDEDGSILHNRDDLIGVDTLQMFGHGSDDVDIVHVRNNRLKLQIEVDRLPGRSYEEDVMGLSREDVGQDGNDS